MFAAAQSRSAAALREERADPLENAEVLEQDLQAHEDQHDAADKLRARLVLRAEDVADADADGREDKGRHADEADGRDDVDLQERKGHADGERVDARGDRERQHGLDAEGIVQLVGAFARLLDHVRADQREQHEGDPVVEILDEGLKLHAEKIADERHQRLKAAEIQAGDQHVLRPQLFDREPLTYRYGEGVHRKADRQNKQFPCTHFQPPRPGGAAFPSVFFLKPEALSRFRPLPVFGGAHACGEQKRLIRKARDAFRISLVISCRAAGVPPSVSYPASLCHFHYIL